MNLNLSAAGLAGAGARHPWKTIGVWLIGLAVALVLAGALLGDALTTEVSLPANSESARANRLLSERLGESGGAIAEMVIVRSSGLTVDDPAYQRFVETLFSDLQALGDELIVGGTHYYLTGDESLVSADRRTTLIALTLPNSAKEEIDHLHRVVERAGEQSAFRLLVTGEATLDAEITEVAERDLAIGEGIGISVALVVLALVFGAVAAACLPIVLAIAAIVVALGILALVGQTVDLPFFVINMLTMMGLAVGIDYALFIVSRFREERANGRDKIEAITTAGATAGRTVLLSGLTVALALVGLLITPDPSNRVLGLSALLVVVAAVLASLTLLPALLGLFGDRINWPRRGGRRTTRSTRSAVRGPRSSFWDWTARVVMRRPVVSLLLAGGALLVVASASFDLEQGEVGVSALPDGLASKEAYLVLQEAFGFGQDLPAVIVIDGRTDAASVAVGVERLEAVIAADPAFAASAIETHPDANLSIVRAWLVGDPASSPAMAAVKRLRADYIPTAFAGAPARVLVSGDTAEFVDVAEMNATYTPIVFAFVLGLSFVLLTVAFRSIVIPVKAILMNLLSVGATYGLLVLVFQKGIGADLVGFQQVEVIQTGLPLFLFVVLFGLSMDYHVFLLSRIRERFIQTGDNGDAVAYGLRSTGRLITGAALIMVAVFGGFALGDLAAMQQFGFGLAIAVFIDATIVRSVLVPASMRLLGEWNWYLPNLLRWLPDPRLDAATPGEAAGAAD